MDTMILESGCFCRADPSQSELSDSVFIRPPSPPRCDDATRRLTNEPKVIQPLLKAGKALRLSGNLSLHPHSQFSPRVISVAPRLTHLLRPLGVPAVVVPAHELHARAVQPLLAAEIQVPRLARPDDEKVHVLRGHVLNHELNCACPLHYSLDHGE